LFNIQISEKYEGGGGFSLNKLNEINIIKLWKSWEISGNFRKTQKTTT
jgi:hypothetical protein